MQPPWWASPKLCATGTHCGRYAGPLVCRARLSLFSLNVTKGLAVFIELLVVKFLLNWAHQLGFCVPRKDSIIRGVLR